MLVKEVGFDLDDLRGTRSVHRTVEEPSPLESFVGDVTPRSARVAGAALIGAGALLAYAAGSAGALFVSVAVAVGLHYASEFNAEPTEAVTVEETPGMDSEEAEMFLIMHDEHEQMKKEEVEAQARKARRRAGGASQ